MTAQATSRTPIVVIGIGNPLRGDDGLGHAAIHGLAKASLESVELAATDGEVTRLIELWRDRRLAVVIDAVLTGAEPGTLHRLDASVDALPDWSAALSSHRAGLTEAVALAGALGRLPDRLLVFGVEPADMHLGSGLSPTASVALDELLASVSATVRSARVAPSPPTARPRESSCM